MLAEGYGRPWQEHHMICGAIQGGIAASDELLAGLKRHEDPHQQSSPLFA